MSEHGTSDASHAVSYQADIKPLFRDKDRAAMLKAFDLWSYADVSAHSTKIAQKLQEGTMPCDGAWPADRVALFTDWVASGSKP
jgi:hypothetical protein